MTGDRSAFEAARLAIAGSNSPSGSLCDPFLSIIPGTGASVSILASAKGQSTICASDEIATRLDELQFDLGEGPCWEAMTSRRPVIASRLRSADFPAWPMFAQAVRSDQTFDVASMFAFPLSVGSLDIGAVDVYSLTEENLNPTQIADAMELAGLAAWQVLRRILADDRGHDDNAGDMCRREVHQATGMVLAQLEITADDAALLLRAHAFATSRTVRDVANDIVARRIDFSANGR